MQYIAIVQATTPQKVNIAFVCFRKSLYK